MAGGHPTVKTKMPGNADYCCGNPKSGIKSPVTSYINGNKARKEDAVLTIVKFKSQSNRQQ